VRPVVVRRTVTETWRSVVDISSTSHTHTHTHTRTHIHARTASLWGRGRSERDGRYTLEKLLAFFELAAEHARFYRAHEFQAQIQGYCALQLWDAVATPDGKAMFNNWCARPSAHQATPRELSSTSVGWAFSPSPALKPCTPSLTRTVTEGAAGQLHPL
jgi:hypothetical protein